jgi:hypothetical protein
MQTGADLLCEKPDEIILMLASGGGVDTSLLSQHVWNADRAAAVARLNHGERLNVVRRHQFGWFDRDCVWLADSMPLSIKNPHVIVVEETPGFVLANFPNISTQG